MITATVDRQKYIKLYECLVCSYISTECSMCLQMLSTSLTATQIVLFLSGWFCQTTENKKKCGTEKYSYHPCYRIWWRRAEHCCSVLIRNARMRSRKRGSRGEIFFTTTTNKYYWKCHWLDSYVTLPTRRCYIAYASVTLPPFQVLHSPWVLHCPLLGCYIAPCMLHCPPWWVTLPLTLFA